MKKLSLKLFALAFCFFMANQNTSDAIITRLEDGSFQITGGEDDDIFNAILANKTQIEYNDQEDGHRYIISVQILPADINALNESKSENDIITIERDQDLVANDLAHAYRYIVVTTLNGEIKFSLTSRQVHVMN